MLKKISQIIQDQTRFLVTSHARPDGDSLGSELGLALSLRQMGKMVDIVNADPHPSHYASLPGVDTIGVTGSVSGDYDAVFVLECGNLERTGVHGLEGYPLLNIDHHPKNDFYGTLNWVDDSAAALGEMIYRLIQESGFPLNAEIATNLYVAILTDTGSFQFANTTAETFRIAGELVKVGADPGKISQSVYMNRSPSRLILLGKILATLDFHPSKKIAWIRLDQSMLREAGASPSDTEGVVNYALSVEGVVMCAFFREEADGFRVSLRSKDSFDVGAVAEEFGGGGHRNAAGLSVGGTFEEARSTVVERLFCLLPGQDELRKQRF